MHESYPKFGPLGGDRAVAEGITDPVPAHGYVPGDSIPAVLAAGKSSETFQVTVFGSASPSVLTARVDEVLTSTRVNLDDIVEVDLSQQPPARVVRLRARSGRLALTVFADFDHGDAEAVQAWQSIARDGLTRLATLDVPVTCRLGWAVMVLPLVDAAASMTTAQALSSPMVCGYAETFAAFFPGARWRLHACGGDPLSWAMPRP